MKEKLSEVLRCPRCGGKFSAEVFESRDDEVIEGTLGCACPSLYPVICSVPRILPDAFHDHSDFLKKHKNKLPDELLNTFEIERFKKLHGETKRSFSKEWLSFEVRRPEEDKATFLAKTGFHLEELKGKRVLDAGCGSGRYTIIAARAGAEVYGVDLSEAVIRTAELTVGLPNVYVAQGDLSNLPFEESFFDYIYSIGVLHHTPDTHAAFSALLRYLAPGGRIAVWLYRRMHPVQEIANSLQRSFTRRMRLDTLHRLSVLVEPFGRSLSKLYGSPKKWVRRLAAALNLLAVGVSTHPDREIRICDTFDWYSPEYQWHHTDREVRSWFEEAGMKDIVNLSEGQKRFYGGQGEGVNFSGVK